MALLDYICVGMDTNLQVLQSVLSFIQQKLHMEPSDVSVCSHVPQGAVPDKRGHCHPLEQLSKSSFNKPQFTHPSALRLVSIPLHLGMKLCKCVRAFPPPLPPSSLGSVAGGCGPPSAFFDTPPPPYRPAFYRCGALHARGE